MTAFNFNSFAQVKVSENVGYLAPYTINDNVAIVSTEIKDGKSADGKEWKRLDITFGNKEGIYKDSTFFLDVNDAEATKRNIVEMSNGGKREMPSRWEQTYYKLAAIGHAFAPEYIEKFNNIVGKCKTFDDFIKAFKAMIDKVANKNTTSMKLVGRNHDGHTYATLPSCVGIAQAKDEQRAISNNCNVGDWYIWMISPFGKNLSFSAYEQSKKNELANAKPTKMETISPIDDLKETEKSDELNLDEIDFEKELL